MKKIVALALVLSLIPVDVSADQIFSVPFGQSFISGIYLPTVTTGQCLTTTGAMNNVVSTGSTCGSVGSITAGTNITITGTSANPIINASGGGGGVSFIPLTSTSASFPVLPASVANQPYGGTSRALAFNAPLGMVIGHLDVSCIPYNAGDAAEAHSYYNPLDTNGLGGATVSFGIVNAANSIDTPLVLGSVVIPTSPQAGPWVVNVSSVVGTPYTFQSGDGIALSVTNTSVSASQWVSGCVPMIGI